jgi:hypothetical protein
VVTRELGIAGQLQVAADSPLQFDPIVFGVIMAVACPGALRRPGGDLGFAGRLDFCRIDIAEVWGGDRPCRP